MIVEPTVQDLLKKANNRYELVIATARRARQISQEKAEKKDKEKDIKKVESPVTIAANEIAEDKVKIISEE